MSDLSVLEDFAEFRQNYLGPAEFVLATVPWWSGEREDVPWPTEALGPERIPFGGRELPNRFELYVTPTESTEPLGRLLLRLHEDRKIQVVSVQSLSSLDATSFLDQLLAVRRPIEWWKTRAFLDLLMQETFAEFDQANVAAGRPRSEYLPEDTYRRLVGDLKTVVDVPQRTRRDRLTPDRLRDVARVYRSAWRAGANPTQAVAERFGKPYSTASRWVVAARKSGALGPADGSRGGEIEAPDE